MEEKKEREKKTAEMRFERIVIKGLASFQGQTRIPEDPLDRELSGLDEIRLFVIRSYMFSFFFFFLSFNTLYIGLRNRGIAAAPAIDDRAGASLDPDSRRSISFVVRATIRRS